MAKNELTAKNMFAVSLLFAVREQTVKKLCRPLADDKEGGWPTNENRLMAIFFAVRYLTAMLLYR